MGKLVVGAIWLFGIGSFFVAPETRAASLGRWAVGLLAAAHVIECVVFLGRLRQAPGSHVILRRQHRKAEPDKQAILEVLF